MKDRSKITQFNRVRRTDVEPFTPVSIHDAHRDFAHAERDIVDADISAALAASESLQRRIKGVGGAAVFDSFAATVPDSAPNGDTFDWGTYRGVDYDNGGVGYCHRLGEWTRP